MRAIVVAGAGDDFCSGFDIIARNAEGGPKPRVGSLQRRLPSHANRLVPLVMSVQTPVVCAVRGPAGTSHLGIMRSDGSELREITEGETLDLAPTWIPGKEQIVFQSAGLGRDRDGTFMGYGSISIQKLDLATSAMTTLVEDERFDHLVPRMAPDGGLLV